MVDSLKLAAPSCWQARRLHASWARSKQPPESHRTNVARLQAPSGDSSIKFGSKQRRPRGRYLSVARKGKTMIFYIIGVVVVVIVVAAYLGVHI
jgi:hypothetical protein